MFISQAQLSSQFICQKNIGLGKDGIIMIPESIQRVEIVLGSSVLLVIVGVLVFAAEPDTADPAKSFIENRLDLRKVLALIDAEGLIVHPEDAVGKGFWLVEGI